MGFHYGVIMQVSELNVNNLVRSAVVLLVGLPVALTVAGNLAATGNLIAESGEKTELDATVDDLKGELAAPCINYLLSKNDSKLEREAKTAIDEVFDGEVDHKAVCNWVVN